MRSALGFYTRAKTINSIHSPFVYDMVRRMFDFSKNYYHEGHIERAREQLRKDNTVISYEDLGAGGKGVQERTISELAKVSTSNKWKCKLIQNLCMHTKPEQILEFGTNLGIVSAYLSKTKPKTQIHTVEGIPAIAAKATQVFQYLKCDNISIYQSSFEEFIDKNQNLISQCDFIYIDGDHSYEGSKEIFQTITKLRKGKTIIILDDINWSAKMSRFWNEITDSQLYTIIDIYKMGIVLIGYDELSPEHFRCIPRILKPWSLGFLG